MLVRVRDNLKFEDNINYENIVLFEILPEHLKLLQRLSLRWDIVDKDGTFSYWENYGNLYVGHKRPYGNSDGIYDVVEITGLPYKEMEETTDGLYGGYWMMEEEDIQKALSWHRETQIALQICLERLKFETGTFYKKDIFSTWAKIEKIALTK